MTAPEMMEAFIRARRSPRSTERDGRTSLSSTGMGIGPESS